MTAKLAIVQPYLPAYRVPFFDRLVSRLRLSGVSCRILVGTPGRTQRARGDAARAAWMEPVGMREVAFLGGSLKFGCAYRHWSDCDAVIVGLMGTSMDTYRALRSDRRVGVWGHVDSYVRDWNGLDRRLELWQLRRAHHVFAYTPGGANYARAAGCAPEKITTVMNTMDTSALSEALNQLSSTHVATFRRRLGLGSAPTFCFVGGLDASKRIGFLAEALDVLDARGCGARVLIAGEGKQTALLDRAARRGQVIRLPYAGAAQKALILRASRAVACPGRIGLLAVDALVAGLPVATTDWPYHAPEAEYLVEGLSRLTAPDDPEAYAQLLEEMSAEPGANPQQFAYPTIDDMVCNFARGAGALLAC